MNGYEGKFTVEQLNYGKVLVLDDGHKLTVAEIKRLTRATKVRRIKPISGFENVDSYVFKIVSMTLTTLNNNQGYRESIYHVEGDATVTSWLALKTDKIRMAVVLNVANIKRLDDAISTIHLLYAAKDAMESAVMAHEKLSEVLMKSNLPDSITAKTPALDAVALGYADAELQHGMDTIAAVLKNKW